MTAMRTGPRHRAEGDPAGTAELPEPADAGELDGSDELDEQLVLTRPRVPAWVQAAVWASLTCALLTGWLAFYVLGVSAVEQGRTQQHLYNQLREQLALATAPIGGDIAPGTPVAVIEAPGIGLRQVVVEGTNAGSTMVGPGHRRDTPLPGQPGISVVYGHATAFGGPFRKITSLQEGDVITVTTGQGPFEYVVVGVRRATDPLPLPLQPGGGRLTLVTAEGSGWRTGWAANRVIYVDANLRGDSQLGPPGRPGSVPTADLAMQADPDALVPLVLWLQLAVASCLAVTWAGRRWGRPQTWLVGVPVLFACLWGTVETLAEFLPNLS